MVGRQTPRQILASLCWLAGKQPSTSKFGVKDYPEFYAIDGECLVTIGRHPPGAPIILYPLELESLIR